MNVHENILGTIGNTPMVKLNAIAEDFPCPVWAKVEYFNPRPQRERPHGVVHD